MTYCPHCRRGGASAQWGLRVLLVLAGLYGAADVVMTIATAHHDTPIAWEPNYDSVRVCRVPNRPSCMRPRTALARTARDTHITP